MRLLDTIQISLDTSIGEVSGEFWSDDLCGLASPLRDADRHITNHDDLAALLEAIGVPNNEAQKLAKRLWDYQIATQREAWAGKRR